MSAMSGCPCCTFLPDGLFLPSAPSGRSSCVGSGSSERAARADPPTGAVVGLSPPPPPPPPPPSPKEALQDLRSASQAQNIVLFDSHGHPQRERAGIASLDSASSSDNGVAHDGGDEEGKESHSITIISIVCSVSPADWQSTLAYASEDARYETTQPSFGVHPWYCYPNLSPKYLLELEELLTQHPTAIVGEIGLCKVARFVRNFPIELGGKQGGLQLQRSVFRDQFLLAARLGRPVSVHCVQQHGVFIKMLKEIREDALRKRSEWRRKQQRRRDDAAADDVAATSFQLEDEPNIKDFFPTTIAMHSYTGTAHHVTELLAFEESLNELINEKSQSTAPSASKSAESAVAAARGTAESDNDDNVNPLFYFGFSHTVNVAMCSSNKSRLQNINAIRSVPASRILAESDVHSSAEVVSGTAAAVAYLAGAVGVSVADMANQTTNNGIQFLSPLQYASIPIMTS